MSTNVFILSIYTNIIPARVPPVTRRKMRMLRNFFIYSCTEFMILVDCDAQKLKIGSFSVPQQHVV